MTDKPTDAIAAPPPPPGLGQRLSQAREHRGLGVLQAAEKLHLEPRVLEALEAEDFDALGAAVYVRGHLQRYAELLGENAAELQALYAGLAHAHTTPDLTRVITERNRGAAPGARVGVWQGGLLTLALVVAALVWWAVRSGPVPAPAPSPGAQTVPPAQPLAAPAAPATAPATAGRASGGTATVAAASTTRVPASAAAPAARATSPAPRAEHPATASPSPVVAASRPIEAATPAPAAAATPAQATGAAANGARVVLRFREDSWAEVYDANGAALYRDIATAGSVHELSGAPPLRLVLGNAAGVGISVNGRNVSLGAALQSTPNAQFSLDRGGRVTESP